FHGFSPPLADGVVSPRKGSPRPVWHTNGTQGAESGRLMLGFRPQLDFGCGRAQMTEGLIEPSDFQQVREHVSFMLRRHPLKVSLWVIFVASLVGLITYLQYWDFDWVAKTLTGIAVVLILGFSITYNKTLNRWAGKIPLPTPDPPPTHEQKLEALRQAIEIKK